MPLVQSYLKIHGKSGEYITQKKLTHLDTDQMALNFQCQLTQLKLKIEWTNERLPISPIQQCL